MGAKYLLMYGNPWFCSLGECFSVYEMRVLNGKAISNSKQGAG